MSTIEPSPSMSAEELAKLRNELRASIERTEEALRKVERLLMAAQPSHNGRPANSSEGSRPFAKPPPLGPDSRPPAL